MIFHLRFKKDWNLNFILLCLKVIIIHNHTPKQKKVKFKPRIELNHHIYTPNSHLKQQALQSPFWKLEGSGSGLVLSPPCSKQNVNVVKIKAKNIVKMAAYTQWVLVKPFFFS